MSYILWSPMRVFLFPLFTLDINVVIEITLLEGEARIRASHWEPTPGLPQAVWLVKDFPQYILRSISFLCLLLSILGP